jgi:integrase
MSGAAVEALAVVAADYGAFVAFTHGEVDRAGSPRHQRNMRWLVALTEDPQRAVPSLEAKILDVGPARLRHAQAVQPEKHGKRGVGVIEALGREQAGAEFAAIHAVALAIGERIDGPIFLGRDGARLDRHAAWRIVRRFARKAGINKPAGPHTLRHAFITAALDAGVPLRDVQEAASHADPRTTMRYDRARVSLDRHATYIVAAFLAGAAR